MKKFTYTALTFIFLACSAHLSAFLQQGLAGAPGNNWGFETRDRDCCYDRAAEDYYYSMPRAVSNEGSYDYYSLPRSAYNYDAPYYENRGNWRRDWNRPPQTYNQQYYYR